MSISEIKRDLRKYEFPQCAKEALTKIDQLLAGRSAPTTKQLDIATEIISEFIYCDSDRRGRRGSSLNPLQELQLIDVICDYLSGDISETARNTIFLSLFGGVESQKRLKIHSILASMAMSASCTPVLLAVGVWLQQTGCSSPQSLQLVENIIRDHFLLNTTNHSVLKSLASTAPQFVANFITAATELYSYDGKGGMKLPPKNLLEVITNWVCQQPSVCTSALKHSAALQSGAIPMAADTPLAGLLAWCALAPLYLDEDDPMEPTYPKKLKLEHEATSSSAMLYSRLQLGVVVSVRGSGGPGVAAAGVLRLKHALTRHVAATPPAAKLQECLDRIGQVIQVAFANGSIYGNKSSLLAFLSSLPENRLIKIILKTQQSL